MTKFVKLRNLSKLRGQYKNMISPYINLCVSMLVYAVQSNYQRKKYTVSDKVYHLLLTLHEFILEFKYYAT
jgi:hypothetical protein